MSATAIIPARFDSVRFPGKVLANRTGQPLIQHVYERVVKAKSIDRVIIATDDERVMRAAQTFGAKAQMTRRDHPNGTSRIAEAVQQIDASIIVNVQADEPDIEPAMIDRAVQALIDHPDCAVATLASPFAKNEDPSNPNIVKIVVSHCNEALYFSRALIPHSRDGKKHDPLKHVGLYVYRREFLLKYPGLAPTPLEQIEQLEQLRFLEYGHRIAVAIVQSNFHGIDTPEQYDAFVSRFQRHS